MNTMIRQVTRQILFQFVDKKIFCGLKVGHGAKCSVRWKIFC
jgi:hypothetical protein